MEKRHTSINRNNFMDFAMFIRNAKKRREAAGRMH
jgi:hypothetical protein